MSVSLCFGAVTCLADEKIDEQAKDDVEKRAAIKVVPMQRLVPAVPLIQDRGDWFESWVFGGISAANARKRLENSIEQRIVLLKEQCALSDEQTSKLELAKRGDIARFFQQVESVRLKVGEKRPDRENMAELSKAISPLQQLWNTGLTGPDSLFFTMIQRVLTEDQKETLLLEGKRRVGERNRFHAMSMIKMIEHSIPLTDHQRQRLLELVMEQATKVRVDSHFEQYVSIQAATQLNDETLSSFLDAAQLATFRQLQRHWETNIPFLNQMVRQPRNLAGKEWLDALQ